MTKGPDLKGIGSCVKGPDCITTLHRISPSDNFDIGVCSPSMNIAIFFKEK